MNTYKKKLAMKKCCTKSPKKKLDLNEKNYWISFAMTWPSHSDHYGTEFFLVLFSTCSGNSLDNFFFRHSNGLLIYSSHLFLVIIIMIIYTCRALSSRHPRYVLFDTTLEIIYIMYQMYTFAVHFSFHDSFCVCVILKVASPINNQWHLKSLATFSMFI